MTAAREGTDRTHDQEGLWREYHDEILLLQPLSLIPFSAKGRALDVGSGDGHSLDLLAGEGFDAVGVDTSPSGASSVRGTATAIPFAGGSFGLVVCLRTLQHIHEEKRVINEIRRVLKPGGHLVLTVANRRSLTFVALKSKGAWRGRERIPYEWFKCYSAEDAKMLLEEQGFEILDVSIVGHAPEVLRRRAPSLSRPLLRAVTVLERGLRALPVIGRGGTHVRVIARIRGVTSSSGKPA